MADIEVNSGTNTEEEMVLKHRRERKELQSKIQGLKHCIAKGDKRRKKEITEEIARLEAELDEKQNNELEKLQVNSDFNSVTDQLQDVTLSSNDTNCDHAIAISKMGKITRAKKRREKKAEKQRERDGLIAQQEIDNLKSARTVEAETLKEILRKRGLAIYEIPSDGNCLYVAVEHQLKLQDIPASVQSLRCQVSEHMSSNPDDFIPFLTDPETGDALVKEQFEAYCREIAAKPVWGGHVELQALSCILKQPIEVIQSDGPPVLLGEKYLSRPLTLTYHRHVYGLGEHYNSVIPQSMVVEDEWES